MSNASKLLFLMDWTICLERAKLRRSKHRLIWTWRKIVARVARPIFEYLEVLNINEEQKGIHKGVTRMAPSLFLNTLYIIVKKTGHSSLSFYHLILVGTAQPHNHLKQSVRESLSTSVIWLCSHDSTFSTQELLIHKLTPALGKTSHCVSPAEILISALSVHAYGTQLFGHHIW